MHVGSKDELHHGAVKHTGLGLHVQDLDGSFGGESLFVRAVRGRQGVEDVGYRHHAGLDRDLARLNSPRVARTIEFLVVPVGNVGYLGQVGSPGDLHEEVVTWA